MPVEMSRHSWRLGFQASVVAQWIVQSETCCFRNREFVGIDESPHASRLSRDAFDEAGSISWTVAGFRTGVNESRALALFSGMSGFRGMTGRVPPIHKDVQSNGGACELNVLSSAFAPIGT